MRYTFTLVIVGLCCSSALSQRSPLALGWIWSAEGGINTSEFGEETDYSDFKPQVSPVVGVHWRYRADSSFYIDAGVRYTMVGHKYTYHSTSYTVGTTQTTTYNGEEYYKFHKIGFGAGMGFYLGPKKMIFAGAGYRLLYYPTGSFFTETIRTETGQVPEVFTASYDPMNDPNLWRKASKIGHEFYFQTGITVHPRVRIELQFCFSRAIDWEESTLAGYPNYRYYTTDDLSLSVFFALRK